MERKVFAVFGILILITVAVLLTDAKNRRWKKPWYQRRFTRRNPTKAMSGGSTGAQINSVRPAQNDNPNEQQDFDSPEDAQTYWKVIYENGK